MKATLLIGGKSDEHERHEADFYPTPKECTIALIDFLKIPTSKRIWEPACGDGAISKILTDLGYFVTSTDLRFTGFGEGGVDFLAANPLSVDCIITNPPFNISVEFISKALKEVDTVAMLLKSTYWHSQKRIKLFKSNTPAYILAMTWRPNMCTDRGKSPTMDFIWTVWIKGVNITEYYLLQKPEAKMATPQFKMF